MEEIKLKRTLGFWAAYSASVGLVVSGTAMVVLGNGYGVGGPAFSIVAFISLLIILCVALSYSELAAMIPGAGMIGEYTISALGKLPALFAVLAGYIVLVGTDGGANMIVGGQTFETLTGVPWYITVFVLLGFLVAINLMGVAVFGKVQSVLAIGMMTLLALLGIWGLTGFGLENQLAELPPFSPLTWKEQAATLGVAIWLFIGMEFVTPLAEEIKNPGRNIPLAMLFGCFTIWFVDLLFGLGVTKYIELDKLAASTIPHVEGAQAMLGNPGLIIMGTVSILAAVTTCDTYLVAVPRMLYGLSREGMLPKFFSYLHPTTRTPWYGIFFVVALILVVIVYAFINNANIELITTMISVACATWLMSYIIAQVNVIVLRKKYPAQKRPFKTPLFPLPQVIGIAACTYMIYTLYVDITVLQISLCVIAAILLFCVAYLKGTGQKLFVPVPLEHIYEGIRKRSEIEDENGESNGGTKLDISS
ncbi:APC family permease [Aneurinibacillus migulanus]|uniref:Amino acid transporter n=1 Tax=Aneurinibacillus migulanus TaxID=47500 RepID=A0A0M0H3M0_ANEMI|nr:APC family permease [Aneurinibacillus migulanus]KON96306.1 amino acid transporter [Aneurinibacillus migulanus]MED0892223.1 APC family permease [Aneurinibacillus migulanus]MED1615825.1 APC family permease [Aneurinibacillus migulanus]SDI25348.1 Amino acid transporter [Aneurinibacillus migulanus]GED12329.1 amino acid APC family transporter [Aneurinibacillus migulanus]